VKVANYLEVHQPLIYKTILNALKTQRLSHAYLIIGEAGTPLLPVATYLAKSIVCENRRPLACEECLTCLRIDDGNYTDFVVYDGSLKTIKKEDIQAVEARYVDTAIESQGKMIYVLHLVENMTVEAVNSLLKFLEEPENDIYAFLTTENESKVLPTIISRTQTLRLKLIDRIVVINEAVGLGAPLLDAEMLSYFYNDGSSILERSTDEDYTQAKEALNDLLEGLKKSSESAVFVSQKTIGPLLKTKESARFYLDMLAQVFRDLINVRFDNRITLTSYDSILKELAIRLPHLDISLIEIMTARGQLDLNLNIPLLLDHIIYTIVKGVESHE
jgi:DNA polymerase III subunit delta'